MRIAMLTAAAIMLAGPVLAQPAEPKASDALSALDRDCQGGKVQACTEASIKRGPSGVERPGGGKEGAREAEQARNATSGGAGTAAGSNAAPHASGEGGAMPMPPASQRR